MPRISDLQNKKQFFDGLDRLDDLAEDSDNEVSTASRSFIVPRPSLKRKAYHDSYDPDTLPPSSSDPTPPSTANAANGRRSSAQPPKLQRSQTTGSIPKKRKGKSKTKETIPEEDRIFKNLVFLFITAKDPSILRRARTSRAELHGARCAAIWDSRVTHIIVNDGLHIDRAVRELPNQELPQNIPIVNVEWLSQSFAWSAIQDVSSSRFQVPGMKSASDCDVPKKSADVDPQRLRSKDDITKTSSRETVQADTTTNPKDDLDQLIAVMQQVGPMPDIDQLMDEPSQQTNATTLSFTEQDPFSAAKGFLCLEKHDGTSLSPNILTMTILQEMSDRLEKVGDKWRPLAYRKAVSALRRQTSLIQTKKEAQAIGGIGESIAAKIEEIQTTGRLRKLDFAKASEEDKRLSLFMGVYGSGMKQAQRWVEQGYRSLEELLENADLTHNHRVGIDHYDDFQQRVPRAEVEQHGAIVRAAVIALDPGFELIVSGSHRRGNLDSGDIDILVTKQGASMDHIRVSMTECVIPVLKQSGFLKAELATSHDTIGSKWHGASMVPGSSVWRRLDLLYVPGDELGAALLYFTGNDIFNRSMRLLAGKKGMRLNQHGLYKDVMRGTGRVKVTEGTLVEGRSEEKIFEILGVTYRPPEHRKP